jgi:ABC-type polysaccharide/polyol phosphate transport system ATPase subunit
MSQIAIRGVGLGKRYAIGERARYVALRDVLANALRAPARLLGLNKQNGNHSRREQMWALRDVSFDIHQGEVVGLIGRNGAGKTTLLKILSRVTRPTLGFAEVHGRMGTLLEVGTGFHPELTGRENVFLSGAILGMGKREIQKKFDEIVAFAEVDKFIDTPLKHFSTGMQMRLAFAVAAQLEPEILLVDEVLAVGDLEFQKKCLGKMSEVSKGGRTIVFVSHQLSQIRRLCERVIWIDNGTIKRDGQVLDVLSEYETATAGRTTQERSSPGVFSRNVHFQMWELLVDGIGPKNVLEHFGPVSFRVVISLPERILKGLYNILLIDDHERIIWHGNFELPVVEPGTFEFRHRLLTLPLKPGVYRWKAGIYDGHRWTDPWWAVPELIVGTKPMTNTSDEFQGILNLPCEMEVRELEASQK